MLELFLSFFRIGIFTFGGGLAMLPMLEREIVSKRGLATREEILDFFCNRAMHAGNNSSEYHLL